MYVEWLSAEAAEDEYGVPPCIGVVRLTLPTWGSVGVGVAGDLGGVKSADLPVGSN